MEKGAPIPVVITIYGDRSFTFEMKTPPMSHFLKKAAKLESGSKTPGRDVAGSVTKAQVKEIAAANYPQLRMFTVKDAKSYTPEKDVEGEWKVCTDRSEAVARPFVGATCSPATGMPTGGGGGGGAGESVIARRAGRMYDPAVRRIRSLGG